MENMTDEELVAHALLLWSNYIETSNVALSAEDASAQKVKFNALSLDQMKLVIRLRELSAVFKGN